MSSRNVAAIAIALVAVATGLARAQESKSAEAAATLARLMQDWRGGKKPKRMPVRWRRAGWAASRALCAPRDSVLA